MRLLPYGDRAVLAEVDDPRLVPSLRAHLAAAEGVIDAVAGARTVLVVFDPAVVTAEKIRAAFDLERVVATDAAAQPQEPVELPVGYDGADLAEVADETGLDLEDLIARHCAAQYTVRFCGFSPGFAYLDGLDPALHVARRREPRVAVPAGAVAIAGEFAGVYPRASPGGWRLLGRTDVSLWDVARDPPALLAPGTRVRFVRT